MIDAHVHLYDSTAIRYGMFQRRDPTFEALIGDYSAMPTRYLLEDYRAATASRPIEGIVWHEFISEETEAEMTWGQALADGSDLPMALVGLIDFADPLLEERLELYRSLPDVTAVRQHLGWDADRPLRRLAPRPDILSDPQWEAGLDRLATTDLRCGLEVFSPQLAELVAVVRRHPDIGFTVAVMGWPAATDADTQAQWRAGMTALSRCDNTVASISGVECIFGLDWDVDRAVPWISAVVELFGPDRCMLGSHLPIDSLSYGFERLCEAYDRALEGCSESEREAVWNGTAREWFRIPT
jgi:predicted TIM-barrel fold metal-dependent hydrolase